MKENNQYICELGFNDIKFGQIKKGDLLTIVKINDHVIVFDSGLVFNYRIFNFHTYFKEYDATQAANEEFDFQSVFDEAKQEFITMKKTLSDKKFWKDLGGEINEFGSFLKKEFDIRK